VSAPWDASAERKPANSCDYRQESRLGYLSSSNYPRNARSISRNLGRKYSFSAKLEAYLTRRQGRQSEGTEVDGNNERLLTPGEVAALFRVDPKTVTRWAASGRITSIRTPGGHRRFRESEVRALLRGDSEPSPQGHPAA
jgi:excisionase family DNA binding protein